MGPAKHTGGKNTGVKFFQWGINAFLLWSAVFTAQAQSPKRSVPALPRPEGPFAVGRAGFDWTDQTRPEVLSKVASAKRELMVYLWCLLSRICGSMEVLEVGLVCDTARFPSLDRCENHKIF